eukprot:GHVN01092557.1.p1 GENE.GHVN01092557.1~~GHVN01092557.1.p1  ORF type:complete len:140 (+),score=12.10 GHVN01092557.1:2258-2677(+)
MTSIRCVKSFGNQESFTEVLPVDQVPSNLQLLLPTGAIPPFCLVCRHSHHSHHCAFIIALINLSMLYKVHADAPTCSWKSFLPVLPSSLLSSSFFPSLISSSVSSLSSVHSSPSSSSLSSSSSSLSFILGSLLSSWFTS